MRKVTLESVISEIVSAYPLGTIFDVRAFELWYDDHGWTMNDLWRVGHSLDLSQVLKIARGRWEVFKVNYAPNGKVKDLETRNEYGGDFPALIVCDGIPFLELRPVKEVPR